LKAKIKQKVRNLSTDCCASGIVKENAMRSRSFYCICHALLCWHVTCIRGNQTPANPIFTPSLRKPHTNAPPTLLPSNTPPPTSTEHRCARHSKRGAVNCRLPVGVGSCSGQALNEFSNCGQSGDAGLGIS
jgi:hypothetical protein